MLTNVKKIILLSLALLPVMLVGCTSSKEKALVERYQQDPFAAQKDARPCVEKIMRHQSISGDVTCQAILAYKKPFCKERQQEGALFYRGYDCDNDNEILMMTLRGD